MFQPGNFQHETARKKQKEPAGIYRRYNSRKNLAARTRRLSFSLSGADTAWMQSSSCHWHAEQTAKI